MNMLKTPVLLEWAFNQGLVLKRFFKVKRKQKTINFSGASKNVYHWKNKYVKRDRRNDAKL